jgi:hypothetical protein
MTARRTAYCERIRSTPRLNTITQPVPNFRSTQDAIEDRCNIMVGVRNLVG